MKVNVCVELHGTIGMHWSSAARKRFPEGFPGPRGARGTPGFGWRYGYEDMEPVLPPSLLDPARRYLELLDQWNRIHALTALEPGARFEELVLDSCALLPLLESLPSGARVADLGTGMGIPAVVLALARPDLEILAMDASRKKLAFVRQAALELGLRGLKPVHGRFEALPPLGADAGVAKAVADLASLGGWWRRHGLPGAPLHALKAADWEEEPLPPGFRAEARPYVLPTRGTRALVTLVRTAGP